VIIRANFTYVDAIVPDGTTLKLCRLRYVGSAHDWQFATYRASHDDYADSLFPPAHPWAPAKTPWMSPAASTSPSQPPGPTSDTRRINESDH